MEAWYSNAMYFVLLHYDLTARVDKRNCVSVPHEATRGSTVKNKTDEERTMETRSSCQSLATLRKPEVTPAQSCRRTDVDA